MKILLQVGALLLLCLTAEELVTLLPFPFPAGVLGMIVLFLVFIFRMAKPEMLQESAGFFLGNMAFFLLPSAVGIIRHYHLLHESILPILVICIISTPASFFVTVYTVRLVAFLQNKYREKVLRRERSVTDKYQ